jgi:Alkylmercury lyase/ABC transporter
VDGGRGDAPPDGRPAIELSGLTKRYRRGKGWLTAVNDVTLRVPHGQVIGLLGPNGAGKTTTIKMACGLILPTAGTIRLGGYDVGRRRAEAVRQIGAVLEGSRNVYWPLAAWQNLMYFGRRPGRLLTAHERTHDMTGIEHGNDAGPADLLAKLDWASTSEPFTCGWAVIGLTNFGERPLEITRLAEVLDMAASEAGELIRRLGGWPGTRVENGIITVNPERAKSAPRRQLQIGDRRFGVSGCAPDIFLYAPLLRPSVQVEETCPVTGTPIRLVFTPRRVEHVEPAGAVLPLPGPQSPLYSCAEAASRGEQVDADACDTSLCSQAPLFSSAEAAQGWLDTHPGGRVFPIRQAWDLSPYRHYRDRMSALLGPGH